MKPSAAPAPPDDLQPQDAPSTNAITESEITGVPGIRAWKGVYWLVFGSLVLWITLLALLTYALS